MDVKKRLVVWMIDDDDDDDDDDNNRVKFEMDITYVPHWLHAFPLRLTKEIRYPYYSFHPVNPTTQYRVDHLSKTRILQTHFGDR